MANIPTRLNNPGDIKDMTTGQFKQYSTPTEGYNALVNDLNTKITGKSKTGVTPDSSLRHFSSIYAPSSDNNNPEEYAQNLAKQLGVSADTPIKDLQPRIHDFARAIAKNEGYQGDLSMVAGDIQSAPLQPEIKLSVSDFASKIKAKYPAYAGVDDKTLTEKMLAKYPEYASKVDMSIPTTSTIIPTPDTQQKEEPGIISQSASQFSKGFKQIKEGAKSNDVGEGLLDISKGVLNEAAGGLRAAFSPVEWATKQVAKIPGISDALGGADKAVNFLADKISNNPKLQEFVEKNPDAEEVASNLITIGSSLIGAKESPEIKSAISPITEPIANAVSDRITTPIRTSLENKYINSTIEDWNRIGGDYVKTDKLLQQGERVGKDTPKFLSQMGINPNELIEGGKFSKVNEVADKLTSESVKPYEKILTKELEVAQQAQPLTDVGELHSQIVKKIQSIPNITPGDAEEMISQATSEMRALQRKYPNGIPLDKINIEKGNYWRNTKFDLIKPLKGQVNYNIGSALKEFIESKVPDTNIRELNSLLGDYYAAGKFLRSLDGKTAKLTAGQKITRGVVKGLATVGGEKLFGFQGGVAGFLLGKSISHVLESASNPLKSWILSNLSKADPAIYKQAIDWLGKQEEARLARLMLPEAAPLGSDKNPIITPNTKGTPNPVPSAVTNNRSAGGKTVSRPSTNL
jgi:hypothetical protein